MFVFVNTFLETGFLQNKKLEKIKKIISPVCADLVKRNVWASSLILVFGEHQVL